MSVRPWKVLKLLSHLAPVNGIARVSSRKPVRSNRYEVSLLFDTSPSTSVGGASKAIARGGLGMTGHIENDPYLRERVDLSVYGFDSTSVSKCYADTVPAAKFKMPAIPGTCSTPLYGAYGDVITHAIERRRSWQQEQDVDIDCSLIFVFSDFLANDYEARDQALAAKAAATENRINLFMLGAGESVDEAIMNELSQAARPPAMLTCDTDYEKFFSWLRRSLSLRSRSVAGQPLLLEDLTGKPTRLEG